MRNISTLAANAAAAAALSSISFSHKGEKHRLVLAKNPMKLKQIHKVNRVRVVKSGFFFNSII